MAKKIPYAIANYEEIVNDGYHFVDKTRFIREIERYKIPVFLRPRRFGKSLWCSILECYYDINRRDRFDTLFGNTAIGREPTPLRNSHLVLRFDFSKIEVKAELDVIEQSFNAVGLKAMTVFAAEYRQFADFSGAADGPSATAGLESLLSAVLAAKTPPVHVIIDEYDNFTNQLLTARLDGLYGEVVTGDSFLRAFYKVIKAGVGEGSVARVFVTGVLPITMDDLTSGFNIGQIITLKEHVLEMMGFTQAETDAYVDAIFAEHPAWPAGLRGQVRDDLRTHYNGYRFLPDASETLYNSTICNFYLNDLAINDGRPPRETIDENLRVDINWLRRLTGNDEETRVLLERLMFDGALPADLAMLRSKFNMRQFFQRAFYPLSLYYLGMLTFRDDFTLEFPNLTVKTIFTEYFNEVENISVSEGYTGMFSRFLADRDWAALFAGYWERYVGQIPAQAFDKANENFFRTTFYELCTRYLLRYLSFAIEVNHPGGRSDWEAVGRDGTSFANQAAVIEFKHFSVAEARRLGIAKGKAPREEDVAQASRYADDLRRRHPRLAIRRYVVHTTAGRAFRVFPLD